MQRSKHIALALGACLGLASAGCHHYHTAIPGVVDIRSDGSGAKADSRELELGQDVKRESVEAIVIGKGVEVQGHKVKIEDRTYWILHIAPMFNTSAAEEVDAALANNGALREVSTTYEVSVIDVVIELGAGLAVGVVNVVPVLGQLVSAVGWVGMMVFLPSFTFQLEGERIQP